MGNLLIGLAISIGVGLVIFLVMIFTSSKRAIHINQQVVTDPTPEANAHGAPANPHGAAAAGPPAHAEHEEHVPLDLTSNDRWLWLAVIVIIIILIVSNGGRSYIVPRVHPQIVKWEWVIERIDTVILSKSYGVVYRLPQPVIGQPRTVGFDFKEATKPYRVVNGYGADTCSVNTENIAGSLPMNVPGNSELRFKLRDKHESTGKLILIISRKVEK